MNQENLYPSISYGSGELNPQLGVDHEVQGGLERVQRLRAQHWILQLQKNLENPSIMSHREIICISLISGECIRNCLILWIISIKEKEVPPLHFNKRAVKKCNFTSSKSTLCLFGATKISSRQIIVDII